MEHRGKAVPRGTATSPESAMASELFDQFVSAATFKQVLYTNRQLCELLRLKPTTIANFYPRLKAKLHSWRAASLWTKLDKRASHKCYNRGKACPNTRVLIIGAGPCGLRTAIEAQLLGAKVVVVEKRDRFSRNNVLHLWPFVIHDLRTLGAKKFFGKFCAGSIDHISIRQLQIILLKVALLLGVEVHENVGFEGLIEPPEDQSHERIGWRARVSPSDHPVSQYEFDALIGADGKRNTLLGFNRKEFRGKLAIAVTANFINRHSLEEARVPEISGVAFIFNQKFFQDMKEQTAIDLENIVYYKDDTHYFVMTAKKQSLLERGVIIQDYNDTARLLASENVDREALMEYARDATDFATGYKLPHLDFAVNHYGQADVAMFDFTSMYAAENACRVIERREHKLLQALVGDSLLEPFWPTGSGCARGFLSSFDAAWMIRSWASGKMTTLQVLAERESIYRLLAQTTPENLSKDLNQYTLNPSSRYPNLNLHAVLPSQVRSLYDTDGKIEENTVDATIEMPKKKRRRESMIHPDTLLNWCKKQVALSDKVKIENFSSSWKDGLALCTIIHHYRPDLIDLSALDPENIAKNNQLAFDICERELGIPPVMTGQEMADCDVPDKLTMVSYISQVYESFRGEIPVVSLGKGNFSEERTASPSKQIHTTPLSILNKVSNRLQSKRKYSIEKELSKERERGENIKKRSSIFTHKRRSRDKGFIGDKTNQDIVLTDYKNITLNKPRESINTRVKNLEEQMKKDLGLRCHILEESDISRTPHMRSEQAELNIKMLQKQLQSTDSDPNAKKIKQPKVGKLRKDEWNVKIFEEKAKQIKSPPQKHQVADKPKIFKEIFASKLQQMDERLKAGGTLTPEEEARYKRFDASLNKLKDRLSKGNLESGDKGSNQTAAMSEHMAKIWDKKAGRKKDPLPPAPVAKGKVRTDSQKNTCASTVCYFCKDRVYLMQHLSAEGLFFHRSCFKCEYCGTALRLGDYAFDRDSGGKFYCTPHFRMQKTDLRQQEIMKRKQAFLSCALEKQDKERIYQILLDNTEKALSPGKQNENASPTVTDSGANQEQKNEAQLSPSNYLNEPVGTCGRDQTPERVEYENSILELSEDELLTSELEEEELTQKNLGPSQDLATSEDDYSDLSTDSESDEEAFAEELERSLTADETRKLAETWNRKYSTECSLIYSLSSSSSADDEGSDTEIGSDDTSHDIDSDAEYSIANSEEDGIKEKNSEAPVLPKTPEEKEFTMEVPVIDLKSMNRVSEDETTSDSDVSEEILDGEEDPNDETGTEVDSGSESESAPLPPPQIPTIIIHESPPQNTDLEQEWNETTSSKAPDKFKDEDLNNTILVSSDSSALNASEEKSNIPEHEFSDNLDPCAANAETSVELISESRNIDGKFIEISDSDKNLDSSNSRIEAKLSEEILEVEASLSDDLLQSPQKVIAPLAAGESSSDLSVSSDIDSLAKEIVSGVLKAAEDSILEHHLPKIFADTEVPIENSLPVSYSVQQPEVKAANISHNENIFCSTPYSKLVKAPLVDLVSPELPNKGNCDEFNTEKVNKNTEIDIYSADDSVEIIKADAPLDIEGIGAIAGLNSFSLSEESPAAKIESEKINPKDDQVSSSLAYLLSKSENIEEPGSNSVLSNKSITADLNDTILLDDSSELSVCNEYLNGSSEHPKNVSSFVTIRRKNHSEKNQSFEWDSDKSISLPVCHYDEDLPVNSFSVYKGDDSDINWSKIETSELRSIEKNESHRKESLSYQPDVQDSDSFNVEVCKQPELTNSYLSQSLPNSSSPYLFDASFPKTTSYSSAGYENVKSKCLDQDTSDIINDRHKSLITLDSNDNLKSKLEKTDLSSEKVENCMGRISILSSSNGMKHNTSDLNTSKEDTKYKGYSGSFAEKVRPKSLFCDAIYLRSLDIKLQKQPFPSLNKSDDKLDEYSRSDDEGKKMVDDSNKDADFFTSVDNKSTCTPDTLIQEARALKHNASYQSSDKLVNIHLSKQKNSGHKQSSVSFSAPESYCDLVSPYSCAQTKAPGEINFPTKVKPKCDLDITKLRQKREKRKSVHEDLQGLPFADEDKLISPVEPLGSSDVFSTPKGGNAQEKSDSASTIAPLNTPTYKTPDLIDEERYLRMQSTVEQEKARQEARARARLKSDEELGLSPNNYRKKYRRQLSLNSINYDELCSDEFCDQEDELEDDIITNFCQTKSSGIEDTFSMFKNTDLYSSCKTPEASLASSQLLSRPSKTKIIPLSKDELICSMDSLDSVESKIVNSQELNLPEARKHSNITSSSETSPDFCTVDSSLEFKTHSKMSNKISFADGSGEDEKSKSNGKKSIFSLLSFGKGNVSKEKMKQKSKASEKDLSTSLPSDIGTRTTSKGKPFSNLKLAISKEKCNKPKAKSVPPESVPPSPLENIHLQEETPNISLTAHQLKIIPKYTVYRNPETTISTFPVHLPLPKMENGLAPKASEDSFSDEDDTQGSKAGPHPNADKISSEKEKKAQRIVQKVQRQQVLKRLRNAQEIQRRIEEIEIQQKELEVQGVQIEKLIRGEQHGVNVGKGEAELEQEWYTLIHTKNRLTREVQELLIRLKDLELEDRHSRLQQEITQRMAEGSRKNATQLIEERKILDEMLKIVDQRNELVKVLEQLRLREEDEKGIGSDVFTKGLKSPLSPGEKS